MTVRDRKVGMTVEYFMDQMDTGGKDIYRAADLANHLNVGDSEAGKLIQRAFGVTPLKRGGYRGVDIFDYIERMEAAPES